MTDLGPNDNDIKLPPALRSAVEHDLEPVTPLPPPAKRTVPFIPIALSLLVSSALAFGLRGDSARLGPWLTWGASTLQMLLALWLILLALREAIPGTTLSRRAITLAFAGGLLTVVGITWWTWSLSPTTIRPVWVMDVWRICVGSTILMALPALALAGWLVATAFPLRPRLAGALCGLGAGLMSDAGWRLFCHYSDPVHVFGAHTLGIAIVTIFGALLTVRFSSRAAD